MLIRHNAQGLERLTGLTFLLALGFWGVGITLPILNVTKFLIFEDEVSLIVMVLDLFEAGDVGIALIVFVFTIVLPAAKLILGAGLGWGAESETRRAEWGVTILEAVGKWTMLDVMVVALVVVTMKTSWIADFELAPGLYFFAGSAILALLAGIGLKRAAVRPTPIVSE